MSDDQQADLAGLTRMHLNVWVAIVVVGVVSGVTYGATRHPAAPFCCLASFVLTASWRVACGERVDR